MLSFSGFQNHLLWSLVAMKMKTIWQNMFQILVAWLTYLVSHQLEDWTWSRGREAGERNVLSPGEEAIFDFISHFMFFMSNTQVRPNSSSLIYVSQSTVHSIVVVVLWHPGRGKLLRHRTVGCTRNLGLFYSLKFLQIYPGEIWCFTFKDTVEGLVLQLAFPLDCHPASR